MNLQAKKIPDRFIKAIPRGFRLVQKQGNDFLLVDSIYCPNGHNLIEGSVRIHEESSIKLRIDIGNESGVVFADAFWGSHAKLFSFIPRISGQETTFVEAYCPFCDVSLMERYRCAEEGCGSENSLQLLLPGGKNRIHVCARLNCPGHQLDISDLAEEIVRSVNSINYFGAGSDDFFASI